jgi:hypothetical protein
MGPCNAAKVGFYRKAVLVLRLLDTLQTSCEPPNLGGALQRFGFRVLGKATLHAWGPVEHQGLPHEAVEHGVHHGKKFERFRVPINGKIEKFRKITSSSDMPHSATMCRA